MSPEKPIRSDIVTGLAIVPVAPAVATSLAVSSAASTGFPLSWSLRGPRRIIDQGSIPCCVSCAIAAAAESANADWETLSPLFHYFVTRTQVMRASPQQTANVSLEDAKSAMEDIGICLNRLHEKKMDPQGIAEAPSPAAQSDGLTRRLPRTSTFPPAHRIVLLGDQNREQEWKMALLTGKPILAGIDLPANYDKPMRRATTELGRLGPSHAVVILGYNDSEHAFIVQDSRGKDWFIGGQWWMPYSFAQSGFVYQAYSFNFR